MLHLRPFCYRKGSNTLEDCSHSQLLLTVLVSDLYVVPSRKDKPKKKIMNYS